jgi:hypothetical protein
VRNDSSQALLNSRVVIASTDKYARQEAKLEAGMLLPDRKSAST